jgi:hypothetical protein
LTPTLVAGLIAFIHQITTLPEPKYSFIVPHDIATATVDLVVLLSQPELDGDEMFLEQESLGEEVTRYNSNNDSDLDKEEETGNPQDLSSYITKQKPTLM